MRHGWEIKRVLKRGKRFSSSFFTCVFFPNKRKKFRAAFIVSKKISKLSVKRNAIRRRFREAIRLEQKNIPYDCIFFPKENTQNIPFLQLQDMATQFFDSTSLKIST
ncbi:ribonuclease P protein component [Candidatus Peregrinibacteria bacterium]|nr:MAG: ribonuclease P protein component [Candidatus Peregrinibacteria bacterium]